MRQNGYHHSISQHPHHVTELPFLLWTFKIYSCSNSHGYNTVIINYNYLIPGTYSFYNWVFAPLTSTPAFPLPRSLGTTTTFSVSVGLAFSDSTYKWCRTVSVFLRLTYFTSHSALEIRLCGCRWQTPLVPRGCTYTTSSSIHLLVDTRVVSMSWLQWTWKCRYLFKRSILKEKYSQIWNQNVIFRQAVRA